MNLVPMVAQIAGGQQGGGANSLLMVGGYMAIIFAIFYFMVIMPQKRKEKARKALIDSIKTGERIIFSGGMIGTVANVRDNILVVKVSENVKVEILRGAVLKVLEKGAEPKDLDVQ
jgi:preprotein translocase subunit YajC